MFSGTVQNIRRVATVLPLIGLVALGACESEANPTGPETGIPEAPINQIVTVGPINASNTDTLVYFSFASGTTVPRTGEWDLAFRRFELRLSSPAIGGSATQTVLGVGLDNNKAASDEAVLAFTPANTRDAFDAVRADQIPDDSVFVAERLSENRQGFFVFGGIPTVNAANYWKLRLADGSFALLRATRIRFTPQFQVDTLYLETRLQTGSTVGPAQTLALTPQSQVRSISVRTNSVVTPNDCNWDFSFAPAANQLAIALNTACDVGSYPGPASPTFANATAANDAPQYADFLSQLVGPIPNSVFDTSAPFRYNLAGNDRLHASFNTYLVKTGTRVYKLQVVDYYSNTGVAGFPTIRYARIR